MYKVSLATMMILLAKLNQVNAIDIKKLKMDKFTTKKILVKCLQLYEQIEEVSTIYR